MNLLPELKAERCRIGSDLQEAIATLNAQFGHKRLAIVAGGDPLFYGVARYLCDRMGKERFEVLPHAGHQLMQERPFEVARLLDDFSAGLPG